jgi:hypothetical protein
MHTTCQQAPCELWRGFPSTRRRTGAQKAGTPFFVCLELDTQSRGPARATELALGAGAHQQLGCRCPAALCMRRGGQPLRSVAGCGVWCTPRIVGGQQAISVARAPGAGYHAGCEVCEGLGFSHTLNPKHRRAQWAPGGRGAHKLLEKFVLQRLHVFTHDRAKADRESTSKLSPHLHFGEISVRHIYYVVSSLDGASRAGNCPGSLRRSRSCAHTQVEGESLDAPSRRSSGCVSVCLLPWLRSWSVGEGRGFIPCVRN